MPNTKQRFSFDRDATAGHLTFFAGNQQRDLEPGAGLPSVNQGLLDELFGAGNIELYGDWNAGDGHGVVVEFKGNFQGGNIPPLAFDDASLLADQTASISLTQTGAYYATQLIDFHTNISDYTGTVTIGDWTGSVGGDPSQGSGDDVWSLYNWDLTHGRLCIFHSHWPPASDVVPLTVNASDLLDADGNPVGAPTVTFVNGGSECSSFHGEISGGAVGQQWYFWNEDGSSFIAIPWDATADQISEILGEAGYRLAVISLATDGENVTFELRSNDDEGSFVPLISLGTIHTRSYATLATVQQGGTTSSPQGMAISPQMLNKPAAGSTTAVLDFYVYNSLGAIDDADTLPTLTAANQAGTNLDAALSSVTRVALGHYQATFSLAADDTSSQQLRFEWSLTIGGVTTKAAATTAVVDKTGFQLAANGLDAISTVAPDGVAATFREMVVQTWRRFFARATKTTSALTTFADDGDTVLTTQSLSDDGNLQEQGSAV